MPGNDESSRAFSGNREARCPCVFLLDTSSSMRGEPIAELNRGLQDFTETVLADDLASKRLEFAVITFGGAVQVVQDFVTVHDWRPTDLTAQGHTHLGAAADRALGLIEARKQEYRDHGISYYKPRIIMITRREFEGESTETIRATGAKIREAETHRRIRFDALVVTDADMELLREISVREPSKLAGLDFSELFLSGPGFDNVPRKCRHESSQQVVLPPVDWTEL